MVRKVSKERCKTGDLKSLPLHYTSHIDPKKVTMEIFEIMSGGRDIEDFLGSSRTRMNATTTTTSKAAAVL